MQSSTSPLIVRPVKDRGQKTDSAMRPIDKQATMPLSRYLLLSVWFALVTGFWEIGFRGFRILIQKQVITGSENPHLPWLTFVAEFLVFIPIGIALYLAAWFRPRLGSWWLAVFALALPAIYSVRSLVSETPWYAWTAMNVGIAAGIAHLFAFRPGGCLRLVRWSVLVLLPASVVLCAFVYGKAALDEKRALEALPPADPAAP